MMKGGKLYVLNKMTTLKFKAGKVDFNEETNLCTPKSVKGQITIRPAEDDESFYDFIWTPLEKSAGGQDEEDELLIIPGDVKWKHVKSCNTGRVFSLSFTSGAKSFYWLQDGNSNSDDPSELSAKDKEISEKISNLIEEEEGEKDVEVSEERQPEIEHPQKGPIVNISDVLTPKVLNDFVDNVGVEKLDELINQYLPSELVEDDSENGKRKLLREVLSSGFYKASESKLSSALNSGAGEVCARLFGIKYEGEGVANYLNAAREQGKKDKK